MAAPLNVPPPAKFPIAVQMVSEVHWVNDLNKCMDVHKGLAHNGNVPQIYECKGSRSEQFILPQGGTGIIQWRMFPDLCLNTPDGEQVIWWDCESSHPTNILFSVPQNGLGPIQSVTHPDKCVSLPQDTPKDGTWFQMSDCADQGNHVDFKFDFIDCVWGAWSEWSACTQECGGGMRERASVAQGGDIAAEICGGQLSQFSDCGTQSCGGSINWFDGQNMQPQAALIRLAEDPSLCLGSDGQSVTSMGCGDDYHNMFILPGEGVGPIRWSANPGTCLDWPGGDDLQISTCDQGPRKQLEFSVQAEGAIGPITVAANPERCISLSEDHSVGTADVRFSPEDCTQFKIVFVHCPYEEWGAWSECTVTCGGGIRTRTRNLKDEGPVGACQSSVYEQAAALCSDAPCDKVA